MKSILNKEFKYRDSQHTDIRVTFARIRRQQKEAEVRKLDVAVKVRRIGAK